MGRPLRHAPSIGSKQWETRQLVEHVCGVENRPYIHMCVCFDLFVVMSEGYGTARLDTTPSSSLSTASKLAAQRVARAKAKHLGGISNGSVGGSASHPDARRFHIAFHLRPSERASVAGPPAGASGTAGGSGVVSSAAFKRLVHDEYLTRYLESLGVSPSRATLDQARAALPAEELRVTAAWKHDQVTVSPLDRASVIANTRAKNQAAAAARRKVARAKAEAAREKEAQLGPSTTAAAIPVPSTDSTGAVATSVKFIDDNSKRSAATSHSSSRNQSRTHSPHPPSDIAPAVATMTPNLAPVARPPHQPRSARTAAQSAAALSARVSSMPASMLAAASSPSNTSSSSGTAYMTAGVLQEKSAKRTIAEKLSLLRRFWAAATPGSVTTFEDGGDENGDTILGGQIPQQQSKPQQEEEKNHTIALSAGAAQLREALAATARSSPSAPVPTASSTSTSFGNSSGGSVPSRPPPLLQVFSLSHVLTAHTFQSMQQSARGRPLTRSRHLIYWVPSSAWEESNATTAALTTSASIHTRHGEYINARSFMEGQDPFAPDIPPLSHPRTATIGPSGSPSSTIVLSATTSSTRADAAAQSFVQRIGSSSFSSSSPSFPSLAHLFHCPPVVSLSVHILPRVRAFLAMVPRAQGWMGEQWAPLAREAGVQQQEFAQLHGGGEQQQGTEEQYEDVAAMYEGGLGLLAGFGGGRRAMAAAAAAAAADGHAPTAAGILGRSWAPGVDVGFPLPNTPLRSVGSIAARITAAQPELEALMGPDADRRNEAPEPAPPSSLAALYPQGRFQALLGVAHARWAADTSPGSGSGVGSRAVHELCALMVHHVYHTVFRPQLDHVRSFRKEQEEWAQQIRQRCNSTHNTKWENGAEQQQPPPPPQQVTPVPMPAQLNASDLSELSLAIQKLFLDQSQRLHRLPRYSLLFLPLLRDLVASVTLGVLHSLYPLWFASAWGQETDRKIIKECDRVMDAQPTQMPIPIPATEPHLNQSMTTTSAAAPTKVASASSRTEEKTAPSPRIATASLAGTSASSVDASALYFRTSALVRSAVPLSLASEGARRVRKSESASHAIALQRAAVIPLSPRAAVARERRELLRLDEASVDPRQQHATVGFHLSGNTATIGPPSAPISPRAGLGSVPSVDSPRIGAALQDNNRFSLSARLARLHSITQASAPSTASGASEVDSPLESHRLLPQVRGQTPRSPRRPATSGNMDGPSAPLTGAIPSTGPVSSLPLFELGLRKVAHRHVRDNVFARTLIAQMPGLQRVHDSAYANSVSKEDPA